MKEGFRKLFEKMSCKNQSYGYLKMAQFKDMMNKAGILIPLKIGSQEVEIIYFTHRKKGEACLVYESFIRAMIHIAKLLKPEMNALEALSTLYSQYFEKLSHLDDSQDELPQISNGLLWEKDLRTIVILAPQFAKVYPLYWMNELVTSKIVPAFDKEQESLKNLQKFMRDFNLSQILQSGNLGLFNKIWEVSVHSDPSFIRIP